MTDENLGTAVLSIVVDSKGLEESLNKAKQQIQKTSRELQRSLTAAPINPVTGKTYAQERALKTALAVSKELVETDLKREQVLRRIGQRIVEAAKVSQGGFGEFSATVGRDPIAKAVRRNQEKLVREDTAQGRALEIALSASKELLETDLKREQALRRISQRIIDSAKVAQGGFGQFSATAGNDPVDKAIRRNQEKRDKAEQRRLEQLDKLDADLVRVRQNRVDTERKALEARKASDKKQAFERQYDLKQAREAEAASKSRRQDLQGRISSGLIGGAFPLLFGQGPGAALGGLAGGVAGGGAFGFGASLVGTGLGASFDALIARSKELAEALRDPIAAFDQLKTTSALSSRGLETYIEALIKSGQTAAAEQLIRADLTRTLNPTTAAALSQANDELARSFSDVQEKLAALTAGPAIAFLQWLDDIIDRLPIQGPAGAEPGQLPTAEQGRSQAGRGVIGQLAGGGLLVAAGLIATLATGGLAAVPGAGLIAAGTASVGAGVLAGGTAARAAGERVPEDLATQQRTAGIQKEIEATQARRIALQKQLIGFTGNETSGAAQLAQTQQVVLASQEASLEALKTLTSLPQDASIDERIAAEKAYKEAVAASLIEVEKLIAANNNQARNLKRATDIRERTTGFSSSGRQGAVLTDAVVKAREDYDKAKAALEVSSIAGLEAAKSNVNKFGQAWRSAAQDLADYNAELRITADLQLKQSKLNIVGIQQRTGNVISLRNTTAGPERDRLRTQQAGDAAVADARRRAEQIRNQIDTAQRGGDKALVASLTNELNETLAATGLASQEAALSLQEFDEQLAGSKASERFNELQSAIQSAESEAQQAAQSFQGAADRYRAAQEGLTSARISAFDFLDTQQQDALVSQARGLIGQANLVNTRGLSDREILSVGQLAKGIIDAEREADNSRQTLNDSLSDLAAKDWNVNVNVEGGNATAYGDVVNGALSV